MLESKHPASPGAERAVAEDRPAIAGVHQVEAVTARAVGGAGLLARQRAAQVGGEHRPGEHRMHPGMGERTVGPRGDITCGEDVRVRGGAVVCVDAEETCRVGRDAARAHPAGRGAASGGDDDVGRFERLPACCQRSALEVRIGGEDVDALIRKRADDAPPHAVCKAGEQPARSGRQRHLGARVCSGEVAHPESELHTPRPAARDDDA